MVLWYLYILDLKQEVSRQSSYIDLHSRFVLHLPECDYIIKELHPLRNTEWPLFVPDVIIALACCRKPPVWRHTHVTVVHVTKACGSGLSERSHVFTQISTWVTCADLRGRGGEGGGVLNHTTHLSVHIHASYGISEWQRTLLRQLPKNPCHIKKMKIRNIGYQTIISFNLLM